jgi:hypothetical protein
LDFNLLFCDKPFQGNTVKTERAVEEIENKPKQSLPRNCIPRLDFNCSKHKGMNWNKQQNLLVLSQCLPALPHRQSLGPQFTVVSKL